MKLSVPTLLFVTMAVLASECCFGQQPVERPALRAAAEALGGLERVQAVKNITLVGYGQYGYMFGGGNITGSINAPQKNEAANDLKRVYDLEHGRFQQYERHNFLFPFAITGGHSYAPVDWRLDGDVAYNVLPDGTLSRVARWAEDAHYLDGVHMRRMFMLNNPVAVVRAALDPSTRVGKERREPGLRLFDLTVKSGDRLTLALDARTQLPSFVRWANPQSNLGQITFTTYFTGYVPFGGLLLPLGYRTVEDFRNVDYLRLFVDNYFLDTAIADLAAPAEVRAAAEPAIPIKPGAVQVAPGIWRLNSYGSTVFEFKDHLAIYELGGSETLARASVEAARQLVPSKPLTVYIASHGHFDHTAGLRYAVSQGLTVVARRNNEGIFREAVEHVAADFPDTLEKNRKPMKFIPVDEHLRLADEQLAIDVYWARANTHMADAVFVHVPAVKVVVEGDIATAARDYQFWADNFMDDMEYYKLDVQTISPVHMPVMSLAELNEMVRGGVQRARERCAAELAKGNYFPGCPIQSKRY